ncbi:unnamed protein product [Ceutorhynchus assimilis]|uniref:Uncharacterized protein n=1 Tax=Ceutorhynchus assimilis TaxID=467358 RepID=A0A9N9QRE7_9CUCU|nr:unnamed protein product [Ceutorhynchus assimilis]
MRNFADKCIVSVLLFLITTTSAMLSIIYISKIDLKSINQSCAGWGRQVDEVSSDQVSKFVDHSRYINIFKQKKEPNVNNDSWGVEPAGASYFTDQKKYSTVDHSWDEGPAVSSYNPEAYVLANPILRCPPPKMSKTAKKKIQGARTKKIL